MATIAPPRSPAVRIVRNLALLWTLLSLLGLLLALGLTVYSAAWGCTPAGSWSQDMPWIGCVLAVGVGVLAAAASLACAVVMLFFAQLFYWGGMQASRARPRRWWSREALFDSALDAADVGESDGDGGDGGD